MGRATQNLHSCSFVVQLALSNQLLMSGALDATDTSSRSERRDAVPGQSPAQWISAIDIKFWQDSFGAWIQVMTKIPFLLSLALGTLTLIPAAAAQKFECPNPFTPNTPAKLEEIKGLLPDVNTMANIDRLTVAIKTLRREGMSKSLIVDHLIGAYCPMVARDNSVPDVEKAKLVRRFSGQVTRLVYSLESDLDIIINVPLTPDVVDAVNTIAKSQGLSGPAWIEMTIDNALQQESAARRQ
jgi:hypothetical protein